MFPTSKFKKAINRILRSRLAARQGLTTKFFDDWQPEFDGILEALPETEMLSHELFRALMTSTNSSPKMIILVTENTTNPVALVGLKNRGEVWEPVTHWLVPGVLFPIKDKII